MVSPEDSVVFHFIPEPGGEPDAEGNALTSVYLLFFSRKEKRVVFFTARSVR